MTGGGYYGSSGSGGGWNCSLCGQWVPMGVFHSCGTPRQTSFGTSEAQLAQILLALGRIEQLLLKEKRS